MEGTPSSLAPENSRMTEVELSILDCTRFLESDHHVREGLSDLLNENDTVSRIVKANVLMNDIQINSMCTEFSDEDSTCIFCRKKNNLRIKALKFAISMDYTMNKTVQRLERIVVKAYAD